MSEFWLPILGYEGKYDISNKGRVRSLVYNKNQCYNVPRKEPLILKPWIKSGPYKYKLVRLCGKNKYIHLLVLSAFIGPKPDGFQGCHNDGNSLNNDALNLRWASPKENTHDKYKHGTMLRGERLSKKLKDNDVIEIRRRFINGEPRQAIANDYGLYIRTVYTIGNRETWKHLK